jgi:hypothetical protein
MQYSNTYEINRQMHLRPLGELINLVSKIQLEANGLEIMIEDPNTKKKVVPDSILRLAILAAVLETDRKAKIIAQGNYSIETLKAYADQVGMIFSKKY